MADDILAAASIAKKIKDATLFVFDLDGTLLNSKEDIADSINISFAKLGLEPVSNETVYQYVGYGVAPLILDTLTAIKQEERYQDLLDLFRSIYDEKLLDKSHLFPHVEEGLNKLNDRNYKLALITNKPIGFTMKIVNSLKLDRFFGSLIVGGDSKVAQKPDPKSLLMIIKATNSLASKTVMTGDSKVDIMTGKNANTLTVGVTYGFRAKEELVNSKADLIIDSFDQLVSLTN
ncbi:MAG: HAD family hydrolase [Nitrospinota bacterium]